MMNTKTVLSVLTFCLFLIACNNNETTNESSNSTNNITPPTSGVMLNPEHGMPGHRCDIAVGAPLNTPAANSSLPFTPPVTQPAVPPVANPLPNINTAPVEQTASGFSGKPNPEHGLPGHRCDMEVGAILP